MPRHVLLSCVIALAASGCLVVPATSTTSRQIATVKADIHYGASRSLALSTSVDRKEVRVTAIRTHHCERDVEQVILVSKRKRLRFSGVGDPRGALFAAILAPVTVPVSLLISGVAVAVDRETTNEHRRLDHVEQFECRRAAANVRVAVELASGDRAEYTTDPHGTIRFRLPDSEPHRGTIVARAETASIEIKYKRRVPAVTAVRDAVTSCAASHGVVGALDVRIAVNDQGLPTKVELDHGDTPETTCVTRQIAQIRFPDHQRGVTLVLPFRLGE